MYDVLRKIRWVFYLLLITALCSGLPQSPANAAAPAPIKDKGTGLVVSSHVLANAIGKDVLNKGGNAVDAAVAVGYALAGYGVGEYLQSQTILQRFPKLAFRKVGLDVTI